MGKKIVEKPLKDIIVELLGKEGRSINDLYNALAKMGIKKHRLLLTGYLQAMADMGILKERIIKPAKVFSVQQSRKRTIYEIVGDKARKVNEENSADVCLYTLYRIFRRPVFLRELNKSGVGYPQNARKIVGEERKKALELLQGVGISIPRNNSAFVPTEDYSKEYEEIMWELVIEAYDLKGYINKEETQQRKLDESI